MPGKGMCCESVATKFLRGERVTFTEALRLWNDADLTLLGMLASERRQKMHPKREVTFVIDRNINYTNICEAQCRFCAFYRAEGDESAYCLDYRAIAKKIEETLAVGGTGILLQGGLNPALSMEYFTTLFRSIKQDFNIHLHALSPPEVDFLARRENMPVEEVLSRLQAAGLDSLPGGGAEILVDAVRRRISPRKITAAGWLSVMEAAHRLGLPSSSTMMFGAGETIRQRLLHMAALRRLQDKTGGFTAFIPWSFKPGNTSLGGEEATGFDYLRTLAMSRIFLDNVANIQVSWVTQGVKVAQLGLAFGANDFGSTMLEENVVKAAGADSLISGEAILQAIRQAGFQPVQRDNLYRHLRTC